MAATGPFAPDCSDRMVALAPDDAWPRKTTPLGTTRVAGIVKVPDCRVRTVPAEQAFKSDCSVDAADGATGEPAQAVLRTGNPSFPKA